MKTIFGWVRPRARSRAELCGLDHTRVMLEDIFGEDLHLKRVESLANGVSGVLNATVASVATIGRAYAKVRGIETKSGIKQIDRLLSNEGVAVDEVLERWVRFVVGETPRIVVAIDWTDFDDDDHTTLCVSLMTTHGRATPLAWKTVKKSTIKNRRTRYETDMVKRLRKWIPETTGVTWLGDRAFGYQEMYETLEECKFDYVLRFRENILIHEGDGQPLRAAAYVPNNGRVSMVANAVVTKGKHLLGAAVFVKRKGMKESWCLATSLTNVKASDIVATYSRRFTIEETFRDTKDLNFGLGLRATHIGNADRRDRMLLLIAISQVLLTLLGVASEASGLDRTLKANTVKTRTMSLINQGLYWYDCLATMRDEWFTRLMTAYEIVLKEHAFLAQVLLFNTPTIEEK